MRLFGYISAILLVAVLPSHAAEKYVCPDGTSVANFDYCPTGKKWSVPTMVKKRDVRISGLSNEVVTGSVEYSNDNAISRRITDEFATAIYLNLKDTDSEFTKIGVTHGEIDKRVWLHISGPNSPPDRETVRRYRARLDSEDRYQIYKSDGTRLTFEDCLVTEVLREARTNPDSDIEFETSCKKPD